MKVHIRKVGLIGMCLLSLVASPATTATQAPVDTWVTLGTGGGPLMRTKRAQSSNVLLAADKVIVFDAGEGVARALTLQNIGLEKVDAIVLSHLHPDHMAGLSALISLRWQNGIVRPLTVYGPVGTSELVSGILASLKPAERTGFATTEPMPSAAGWLKVEELPCRGEVTGIGGVSVKAVLNSHYSLPDGKDAADAASCSFRVETGRRSIVYTGDTGPSPAVTELARDADLLISEVIDLKATFAAIEKRGGGLSPAMKEGLTFHLIHHHLVPEDVGKLATAAGVKRVVLTHLSPGMDDEKSPVGYIDGVRRTYRGPVTAAADGDRF
ncbi:MAG: MBL fold metallo-hydrolase [Sphingobium sp.]|nr:MBL fold metallo-hydrolase [Sphingobium sp.]